jgi:hypothetical protein
LTETATSFPPGIIAARALFDVTKLVLVEFRFGGEGVRRCSGFDGRSMHCATLLLPKFSAEFEPFIGNDAASISMAVALFPFLSSVAKMPPSDFLA